MACYNLVDAYIPEDGGKYIFTYRPDLRSTKVACNVCVGCRLERARQWAVRCMHEASCWSDNCFVTLTYSPETLP